MGGNLRNFSVVISLIFDDKTAKIKINQQSKQLSKDDQCVLSWMKILFHQRNSSVKEKKDSSGQLCMLTAQYSTLQFRPRVRVCGCNIHHKVAIGSIKV